jgi:ribosomal protein L40E
MSRSSKLSKTESRFFLMARPLFLFSECFGCGARYSVVTEFCGRCQTGQWLSDEWLEAENE